MKIALCGYSGKTGREVYQHLKENHYDVIGVDLNSKPLYEIINQVDIVIDFTNKKQALKHIYICLDYHKPFIVATTGFEAQEIALIKSLCFKEKVKGMICYNFSLPINFILNHFSFLNQYFKNFEYCDIHHLSKLDKVSGTTYLFMLKNNNIKITSKKTSKTQITYVLTCKNEEDQLTFIYQVQQRVVFAKGIVYYLKTKDESFFMNLLA